MNTRDFDDLLDDVQVCFPEEREYAIEAGNTTWAEGWYAVSTGKESIIAYFQNEEDAFAFRMMLINCRLNLGKIASRY
ncbi:MAG: hypothetical protein EB127_07605 [Alphaproteobacteria bacterium]|nr:hypothetical protein [Alphaproteobacteria bacterium]